MANPKKRRTTITSNNLEKQSIKKSKHNNNEISIITPLVEMDYESISNPPIENMEEISEIEIKEKEETEEEEEEEDDDSIDWETIELPTYEQYNEKIQYELQREEEEQIEYKPVEVVFEAPRPILKKSKWEMSYQRQLRDWMHNSHVVLLIGHFLIRNKWCSRQDVQSVCLSVIPDYIQKQTKRKKDSEHEFSTSLKWLLTWWNTYFKVTSHGLITRSYDEYQLNAPLFTNNNLLKELELHLEKLKIKDSEVIQDPIEFVDYFAKKSGSSNISTQLFTAILRTLGFEARLISSLQPIPYRIPASNNNNKNNSSKNDSSISSKDIDIDQSSTSKLEFPLKKTRSMKSKNKEKVKELISNEYDYQNKNSKPPTSWNEVWNPFRKKWITIDPIRQFYNEPKRMEPSISDRRQQLSWVLAFEENEDDSFSSIRHVVDVTKRYSSHLQKSISLRERILTKKEKQDGLKLWSDILLTSLHPIRHHKDEKKKDELEKKEFKDLHQHQPMPTSIQGFKNHPLYALERHLKKLQIIYPINDPSIIIGRIKGEKIFPRSCVYDLHTPESWLKKGRIISKNQSPIKQIQPRAATIEKKRILEDAKLSGHVILSDCYGYWQTEPYQAPPVIDGKITRNAYGRIDLFTPDMLPEGAAHIEIQGIGKIARKLGIDFAEAVIDFEFSHGKSVPLINGIIVAKENELILLEAWSEHNENEKNKAAAKKEKEKYIQMKRSMMEQIIDARVDEEYSKKEQDDNDNNTSNNSAWDRFLRNRKSNAFQNNQHQSKSKNNNDDSDDFILEDSGDDEDDDNYVDGGGFLPDDDD